MPAESHKVTHNYAQSICFKHNWEEHVAKLRPRGDLIQKLTDLFTYQVKADQCKLPCQRVPVYVSKAHLLKVLDLNPATVMHVPDQYLGEIIS